MQTKPNYSMLTDFYEYTMANGYFLNGWKDRIVYFDIFFRQIPDLWSLVGYAVIFAAAYCMFRYSKHHTD